MIPKSLGLRRAIEGCGGPGIKRLICINASSGDPHRLGLLLGPCRVDTIPATEAENINSRSGFALGDSETYSERQ
jgi:hypothetical protein